MKKLYRLLLAPGLLTLALLLVPCQAYAAESTAEQTAASASAIDASQTDDTAAKESQAALTAPGSHIETVPADDVPIEEAGRQIIAPGVDDLCPLADAVCHIADVRDLVAADGHAALIDLARVNIDDLTILDDQIGRLRPLCNSQQFLVHHATPVFMIS